jgi:hypothetical protein
MDIWEDKLTDILVEKYDGIDVGQKAREALKPRSG